MLNLLKVDASFLSVEGTIEIPHPSDIPELVRFSQSVPVTAQHRVLIQDSGWSRLIASGDVVWSRTREGSISGLYAANYLDLALRDEKLQPIRAAKNILCNRFRYQEVNVAFGAFAIIDPRWSSSDLRTRLLRDLLRAVGYRYRCLFTCVSKDNLDEMNTLPTEGWRCFHEEDDACYMMLDVAKALRQLASSLLLHMPHGPKPAARAARA